MFEKYDDIVNIENLMEMLHIGKSTAYKLLKTNKINHLRVGKKYIIPKTSVLSFLDCTCYNEKNNQWQAWQSKERSNFIDWESAN